MPPGILHLNAGAWEAVWTSKMWELPSEVGSLKSEV